MKSLSAKDAHLQTVAMGAVRQSFAGVFERLKRILSNEDTDEYKLASIDAQRLIHVRHTHLCKHFFKPHPCFQDMLKISFGEAPPWLAVDSLRTELVLEVFEELLNDFANVFMSISPLLELISKNLPAMIDKLFRIRKVFPIVIRLLRIILALSRNFPEIIFEHSEVLFILILV